MHGADAHFTELTLAADRARRQVKKQESERVMGREKMKTMDTAGEGKSKGRTTLKWHSGDRTDPI